MTLRHLDPPQLWRLVDLIKVVDGDTFDALLRRDVDTSVIAAGPGRRILETRTEELEARVRLSRVDTPERGQAGYHDAAGDLAFWLDAHAVDGGIEVRAYVVDTFDRLVSDVYPPANPSDSLTGFMLGRANRGAGWPAWIGS